jgi:hypothetical protein
MPETPPMRIVHITAGAGGRICGSCLHDNALVRALRRRGRDAILLPAYVPTTTDEEDVAEGAFAYRLALCVRATLLVVRVVAQRG